MKTKTKKRKNEKGFTLVELAIVLVIVGLLLGAVLKGQQMIENAKIKAVVDQAKSLIAATHAYNDRYGQLPGDDNQATTHLSQSGCTVANGNNDGYMWEYFAVNEHLACGGFITGSYNGTSDTMKHKFDSNVYVLVNNSGYGITVPAIYRHMIRFDNLPGTIAEAVDRLLDDGIYTTGSVRGSAAYTNTTVQYLGVGI